MAYQTSTEKAINFWKAGDKIKALKMFKSFKLGVSKAETRIMQIAYEMQTGNDTFYINIGFQKETIVAEAEGIVLEKWINK